MSVQVTCDIFTENIACEKPIGSAVVTGNIKESGTIRFWSTVFPVYHSREKDYIFHGNKFENPCIKTRFLKGQMQSFFIPKNRPAINHDSYRFAFSIFLLSLLILSLLIFLFSSSLSVFSSHSLSSPFSLLSSLMSLSSLPPSLSLSSQLSLSSLSLFSLTHAALSLF